MPSFSRRHSAFLPLALFGVGILFAVPVHASAATQFFVDPSYDDVARAQISATHLLDGSHAHFYVENSFLDSLSSLGQQQLSDYTQKLSDDFDNTIYPNETLVFGNEWKPGIDSDLKIYILITPMKDSAGGYFRPQDEAAVSQAPDSNEHEMLYLNAHLIALPHEQEFLAHEFQHLINYNQKTRMRNVQDEVWFNEMLSEAAPMVAGVYQEPAFSYDKSNLHDRVTTFLATPNDDLLDWTESTQNYASIALLGYYLYEHYGPQLFTDLEQTDKTGVPAFDQALQEIGSGKTFAQVFSDWEVAAILNDCNAAPKNLYCYTDSFLGYDNLHIQFRKTDLGTNQITFDQQQTDEWAGNWFRYNPSSADLPTGQAGSSGQTGTQGTAAPTPTYVNFSFAAPPSAGSGQALSTKFLGSYIVYSTDGSVHVYPIGFINAAANWSVAGFGTDVKQVDVVFGDFFHPQMTQGNPYATSFNLDAVLSDKPATQQPAMAVAASLLQDGDLIRATGDSKVYVISGNYKRWIQTADIFNSYGNLHWDAIKDVSADTLAQYATSSLVQLSGDPRVFIENPGGTKQWITTQKAFTAHGYRWNTIFTINQKEFNLLPMGAAIAS